MKRFSHLASMVRHSSWFVACLVIGIGVAFTACMSQPRQKADATTPALRWPPAPADPRIAYVQSISIPADVGVKTSGFKKFAGWFTGRNKNADALKKPFGVALDDGGNLCITDMGDNAVCYFDRTQKRFLRWQKVGRTSLVSPVAIAKKNETFFIADSGLGRVLACNQKGQLLFEIKNGLTRPSGLVITGDTLFVADSDSHCVVAFSLDGKLKFKFGHRGTAPGEFNFPTHVAADRNGSLYVTDSLNSRVEVFDSSGKFIRVIGNIGDTSGHFSRPKGSAIDSMGNIYVVDALFDNFQIFDANGAFLLGVGKNGTAPGEFWLPNAIAIGQDDSIFITDSYNHRVQVFKYVGGR